MYEIKVLEKGDLIKLKKLIRVYEIVFEMKGFEMPGDLYLQSLLDREGTIFLVAEHSREIVGGLTAHNLPSTYFEANEVYVYDLAVANHHQRKGIGKLLLKNLKNFCKINGEKEFFLQADRDDTDALEFYHSTGGVPEDVIHFSYDTSK